MFTKQTVFNPLEIRATMVVHENISASSKEQSFKRS